MSNGAQNIALKDKHIFSFRITCSKTGVTRLISELLYSLLKRQLPSSSSFLHRLKSTNTFKHLLGFPLSWDPFLKKRTEKIKNLFEWANKNVDTMIHTKKYVALNIYLHCVMPRDLSNKILLSQKCTDSLEISHSGKKLIKWICATKNKQSKILYMTTSHNSKYRSHPQKCFFICKSIILDLNKCPQ